MQQRLEKCFILLLYGAVVVGGIWIAVRFLLPWTAPFILALILAAILEPAVRYLTAKGFKRGAAAGILSLGTLAVMAVLLFLLSSKCISAAADFVKKSPQLMMAIGEGIENLEKKAFSISTAVPDSVEQYMKSAMESLLNVLYRLPALASQHLLDFLGRAAQKSPNILLFTVTAGLGTYFISATYPDTTGFLLMQLPQGMRHKMRGIREEFKSSLGGFFRAQLILMAMSFFQLLITFYLLDVENAGAVAAITALIDALPVFGTGIVLVPWALYSFILGDYSRGIGFLVCWGMVNLVRSCAQAKLTGDEIGLNPLTSLAAVYIGWKVCGVGGMLLFPLLFSLVQQLQEKKIIRLWKSR